MTDLGWIMGPGRSSGALALGSTVLLYDGAPTHPGPDRLWATGGAPRHHDARRLAHADPRADPRGHRPGPPARPLLAPDPGVDGRAVEPRRLPVAASGGRGVTAPHHQPLRRDRGRRVLPLAAADLRAEAVHAPRARPRHGRRHRGRGRVAGRARRGGGARLPPAVAVDDPRHLGRPRALPRHVLAPLPRHLGPRRLGDERRGRVLVPARAFGRHALGGGQATRSRGGRERARVPSGGGGVGGDRRAARPQGGDRSGASSC